MEVVMPNEEMDLKIPLINHYKEYEEEAEAEMEETLVGRRSRGSSSDANGTTGDENGGAFSSYICENLDKSEVKEHGNEDGSDEKEKSNHSVYFDNKEAASTEWSDVGKNLKDEDLAARLKDVDIQKVLSSVINGKNGADLEGEILSGFSLPPSAEPLQKDGTSSSRQTQSGTENLQVDIVDEIDEEVIELEFERAVQKMHTHNDYEMYCPNCSNRITKVVLRRKIVKRIPASSETQRPNKPQDLFGCLSCFSIFIAAGNKLNPFRIFGRDRGSESSTLPQQQQTSEISQSLSDTGSTVQQQAVSNITSSTTTYTQTTGNMFDQDNCCSQTAECSLLERHLSLFSIFGKGRVKGNVQPSFLPDPNPSPPEASDGTSKKERGMDASAGTLGSSKAVPNGKALLGSAATKVAAAVALGGNHFQTSSLQASSPNGRVVVNSNEISGQATDVAKDSPNNSGEFYSGHDSNGTILHGKARLGSTANKLAAAVAIAGKHFQNSSPQGSKFDGDVIIDMNNNLDGVIKGVKHSPTMGSEIKDNLNISNNQQAGSDVHVLVGEGSVQTETSQTIVSTTVTEIPGVVTRIPSSRSLEIVKAIVYGGLMESIASLSIVSAAAASGATTLKIVALGLANLISGLVVLGHNLRDLKYGEYSQSDEAVTKYTDILGRRENFILHAVVAVLSYLVFGLVAPITYGSAFRESDDIDYKLLAVGSASLLCIIILGILKAYTRGQHNFSSYFKTVSYYVVCAAMCSGIAYAVGDLAKKLLERSGLWETNPVKAISFPETNSINPALASY